MTTYRWTGLENDLWSNPKNWDLGEVPNSEDAIVLFEKIEKELTIDNDNFHTINKIIFSETNVGIVTINRYVLTFAGKEAGIHSYTDGNTILTTIQLLSDLELNVTAKNKLLMYASINDQYDVKLTGQGTVVIGANMFYKDTYISKESILQISDATGQYFGVLSPGNIYNDGTINLMTYRIIGDGVINILRE